MWQLSTWVQHVSHYKCKNYCGNKVFRTAIYIYFFAFLYWVILYKIKTVLPANLNEVIFETLSHSASREIPHVFWDLKVYYVVHSSSPSVLILNDEFSSYYLSWRSMLIFSSCLPQVSQMVFFPAFSQFNILCVFLIFAICVACPAHPVLDLKNWIVFYEGWETNFMPIQNGR